MARNTKAIFFLSLLDLCILIVLLASFYTKEGNKIITELNKKIYPETFILPQRSKPILFPNGKTPIITAKSAYVIDTDNNNVLLNYHGDTKMPMASITKIMTALIAIEQTNNDILVPVKQDAIDEVKQNNGSNAQLVVGDKIPMEEMLYALLLPSGDDAAIAIADAISGNVTDFTGKMNEYAKKLRLFHTHFINPDGLTYYLPSGKANLEEYTTAADLVHLTEYAMHYEKFRQIVALQEFKLPLSSLHGSYTWKNTDSLLSTYSGAEGIKTGYTAEAGYCLVFSALRQGHHIIGVVLNEDSPEARFTDATRLLDWSFSQPQHLAILR